MKNSSAALSKFTSMFDKFILFIYIFLYFGVIFYRNYNLEINKIVKTIVTNKVFKKNAFSHIFVSREKNKLTTLQAKLKIK